MVHVALRRRRRHLRSQKTYGWALALIGVIVIIDTLLLSQNAGDSQEKRPLLSASLASPERLVQNSQNLQSRAFNVRAGKENDIKTPVPVPDWLGEDWQDKECIPFDKWQLMENSPFSCNTLHEMPIAEPGALNFINCGGSRCAFSIKNDLDEKVILKWTKMSGYEKESRYESAWKDIIAMERLQGSDYILDIYGNCGSSQMVEVASRGALYDQMVVAKNTENAPDGLLNDPETNLRVSYHLASAVADLHSIDATDATSFVHNDICCDQYLFIDGVFKLNDFNLASTQLRNRTSGLGCKSEGAYFHHSFTKLRAPEEVLQKRYERDIHRDKVDVWMMGDVLYYVLTKKWVMEGRTNKEAVQLLAEGKRARIPSFIEKSKNPAHQAMIQALGMAWTQDPDERPPAREIAAYLEQELITINAGKSDAPWRVSARPLPPNYDFSAERPKNAISSFVGWYDNYKNFPDDRS